MTPLPTRGDTAVAAALPRAWLRRIAGAAFGATRALSLLPARRAADPASLVRLHHRLGRAQAPAGRAALAAEAAAIALVVVALL